MSHISAIVCTSKIAGFISVNGLSIGPCSIDNAVSIPWDGNTPLFISFAPEGGNYLNTSLMFSNMSNLPQVDNAKMTLWTGVVEIQFNPKRSVVFPPPLLPIELHKDTFYHNDIAYSVSLIDYCGTWLIIDNPDDTKLCEYLSHKTSDYHVDIISNSPVLIQCTSGRKDYVVNSSDESYELHSIGDVACTINDK